MVEPGSGPNEINLLVRDTGIGIAPEARQRIFRDFEQADEGIARSYGGTALGLSISERIVKRMGGRITLESTLDAGSTFEVSVPLAAAEGDGLQDFAAPDLSGQSIMLVAPQSIEPSLISRRLQRWGAQTCLVSESVLQAFGMRLRHVRECVQVDRHEMLHALRLVAQLSCALSAQHRAATSRLESIIAWLDVAMARIHDVRWIADHPWLTWLLHVGVRLVPQTDDVLQTSAVVFGLAPVEVAECCDATGREAETLSLELFLELADVREESEETPHRTTHLHQFLKPRRPPQERGMTTHSQKR